MVGEGIVAPYSGDILLADTNVSIVVEVDGGGGGGGGGEEGGDDGVSIDLNERSFFVFELV